MDEIVLACFLFLKSYGVEPIDSVHKPIITVTSRAEIRKQTGLEALGACIDGHIYLDEKIDFKTVEGKSTVCHELVHFTQNMCPVPKTYLVREFLEKQAYDLQNQYLIDNHSKWRAHNPGDPHPDHVGYIRPIPESKNYLKPYIPTPESADEIRKRFERSDEK